MKKIPTLNQFVEAVDNTKKKNPKDLSSDQDLTIALMNLISIEEHLMFSGAKTGKTSFYDMISDIRELRKNLMLQVIPAYEGEVWCISKHLLATSMRLMEVGTKQQSMGNKEKAYDLFNRAYDLYCLFWGLNMNLIDTKDTSWKKETPQTVLKEADQLTAMLTEKNQSVELPKKKEKEEQPTETSTFSKLKAFVRKAVDCCIE